MPSLLLPEPSSGTKQADQSHLTKQTPLNNYIFDKIQHHKYTTTTRKYNSFVKDHQNLYLNHLRNQPNHQTHTTITTTTYTIIVLHYYHHLNSYNLASLQMEGEKGQGSFMPLWEDDPWMLRWSWRGRDGADVSGKFSREKYKNKRNLKKYQTFFFSRQQVKKGG